MGEKGAKAYTEARPHPIGPQYKLLSTINKEAQPFLPTPTVKNNVYPVPLGEHADCSHVPSRYAPEPLLLCNTKHCHRQLNSEDQGSPLEKERKCFRPSCLHPNRAPLHRHPGDTTVPCKHQEHIPSQKTGVTEAAFYSLLLSASPYSSQATVPQVRTLCGPQGKPTAHLPAVGAR